MVSANLNLIRSKEGVAMELVQRALDALARWVRDLRAPKEPEYSTPDIRIDLEHIKAVAIAHGWEHGRDSLTHWLRLALRRVIEERFYIENAQTITYVLARHEHGDSDGQLTIRLGRLYVHATEDPEKFNTYIQQTFEIQAR